MSTKQRYEHPIARVNPSGKKVWVARYTNRHGEKRSAGTFSKKGEAQKAIDAAYLRETRRVTTDSVAEYAQTWTDRHPRSQRTNDTNDHRISRLLDVELEGKRLADWQFAELRRRHVKDLVAHMLVEQGRSPLGATNILRAYSAMCEDAIEDEVCDLNPFKGVTVRTTDPRATKSKRPVRVWSFEQMHAFAAAAGPYEPMIRTFADTTARLGEVLGLYRSDLDLENGLIHIGWTAQPDGRRIPGTKTDHDEDRPGRNVPVAPGLAALLRAMPTRIDTPVLFPTPRGKVWRQRNFYRDVWYPTQKAAGMDIRPHEMRHSFITNLRAAGVDDADLAAIAGHTVQTMIGHYTHALTKSYEQVKGLIG